MGFQILVQGVVKPGAYRVEGQRLVPKVVANGELSNVTDIPRIRHFGSLLIILVRFVFVLFDNFGQCLDGEPN